MRTIHRSGVTITRRITAIIFMLASIQACETASTENASTKPISVQKLLEDPEKYEGQYVEVYGIADISTGHAYLKYRRNTYYNGKCVGLIIDKERFSNVFTGDIKNLAVVVTGYLKPYCEGLSPGAIREIDENTAQICMVHGYCGTHFIDLESIQISR